MFGYVFARADFCLLPLARHVREECLFDARKGWRKSGHVLMLCIQMEHTNQADLIVNGVYFEGLEVAALGVLPSTALATRQENTAKRY